MNFVYQVDMRVNVIMIAGLLVFRDLSAAVYIISQLPINSVRFVLHSKMLDLTNT